MKLEKIYYGLAVYFAVVGVFGWLRSGSIIPFAITAGAGGLTAFLGSRLKSDSLFLRSFAMGWLGAFAAASLYSAFGRISAHTQTRPEAVYIFLSLATLSCIVILFTIRDLLARRKTRP